MDNTDDLLTVAHYQAWPLCNAPNVEVFVGHAWMASQACFEYAIGALPPRYPVPAIPLSVERHATSILIIEWPVNDPDMFVRTVTIYGQSKSWSYGSYDY